MFGETAFSYVKIWFIIQLKQPLINGCLRYQELVRFCLGNPPYVVNVYPLSSLWVWRVDPTFFCRLRYGSLGCPGRWKLGSINGERINPIGSMYGIYTYIWLIFMVNVGKYTIHGSYGNGLYRPNIYHL